MALLIVNDKFGIPGKFSVQRYEENESIQIQGTLATHYYIEEIESIKSERYELTGVEVFQESFGSDDFDIVYNFKAEEMNIIGGMSNMDINDIENIETKFYKKDNYILKESSLDISDNKEE